MNHTSLVRGTGNAAYTLARRACLAIRPAVRVRQLSSKKLAANAQLVRLRFFTKSRLMRKRQRARELLRVRSFSTERSAGRFRRSTLKSSERSPEEMSNAELNDAIAKMSAVAAMAERESAVAN